VNAKGKAWVWSRPRAMFRITVWVRGMFTLRSNARTRAWVRVRVSLMVWVRVMTRVNLG
jgi:hypothetical protein